jgi:protein TonB
MRANRAATIPQSPGFPTYGALECKRSYQKHLGLAVMAAGTLHLLAMWGFLHYADVQNQSPQRVPRIVKEETGIPILPPPPPISLTRPEQVPVQTGPRVPISLGLAEAVPDQQAPEESMLASQQDLGRLSDKSVEDILAEGSGDSIVITTDLQEHFPERGEYVYRDEEPAALNPDVCEYPALALQASIEGTVWIEALVDKDGRVKDAWVVKPSGCSAGFEEAALEAAYKTKYKPALSNGQPVAVRITYPVYFLLK